MKSDKLLENMRKALQGKLIESNDKGLLAYKEPIERLLDLTFPNSSYLNYDYEIQDDHIELQCKSGPSGYDMQAINGLEGWCKRFAKQIPNYNEIFYDELGGDWYSGMTFSKSAGYWTVKRFWFSIYVKNNEKLADTFGKYNVQDLDNQIKSKQDKYTNSQIEKAKLYLTEIGFTEEQVDLIMDTIIKRNLASGGISDLKKLQKRDIYKDIPLKTLSNKLAELDKYDHDIPMYYLTEYIIEPLADKIEDEKQKENDNNFLKNAKETNPELVEWSKSIIDNSGFNDYYKENSILAILKAINNGYTKKDIENVINYYSDRKNHSKKDIWIRYILIRAMAGEFDLDKSKIQYLINLAKDYSAIKYEQTIDEIVDGLQMGLTTEDIDNILNEYETPKGIRRQIKYLLRNK